MTSFVQRFGACIIGTLSGFDRLRLRGTKRLLASVRGMQSYLWQTGLLLKDFGAHAEAITATLRRATEEQAHAAGRPLQYVGSPSVSKEELARQIAARDGVRTGLITVLSSTELCWSYEVYRNRATRHLELRAKQRKCLHYYHYFLDPEWGFCHVRVQTWFPFTLHVGLNGREWLARQLDAAGIGYRRRDNCFVDLADVERAQALCDQQLQTDWPAKLNGLAARSLPSERACFAACPVPYYWSVDQSEWATDVLFRTPQDLAAWYPRWLRHGLERLGSRDVLRFLGRHVPLHEGVGRFAGEVTSELKGRPEGLRLKHCVNANSVKMYDKQGSVLRVETTINQPRDMKVYRPKEGGPEADKQWRYLRKGIADLHRRAEVSQQANERYLESLATVVDTTSLAELTHDVCRPVTWKGRRARALQPLADADAQLLAAVHRGEFVLTGFRNGDLRPLLFGAGAASDQERRRQSAAVTRKLRLLRAHGLIRKVPKTHRYLVSDKGRQVITAVLAARQADTAKLTTAA